MKEHLEDTVAHRKYMGTQGNTREYRGMQGNTRKCRGINDSNV